MQGTGPLFGVTPLVWKEGWQVCGDKGNPILGTLCICWLTIAAETYQMRETSLRTRNSLTLLKKKSPITRLYLLYNNPAYPDPVSLANP